MTAANFDALLVMLNSLRYSLRRLKRLDFILRQALYDAARYYRYCAKSGTPPRNEQLPGQLRVQAHALEKGLADLLYDLWAVRVVVL